MKNAERLARLERLSQMLLKAIAFSRIMRVLAVGKKLARNALKQRAELRQAERRDKLTHASWLLERWGHHARDPLSPFAGHTDEAIAEQMTLEVILNLSDETQQIAEYHWARGLSPAEIADSLQLDRARVRESLALVREQVADKVLG